MIFADDYAKEIADEFVQALNEYMASTPMYAPEILHVRNLLIANPFELEFDDEHESHDEVERDPESGVDYDHDITICSFRASVYVPVGHFEVFVKADCEVVEDYTWETDDSDSELTVGEVHICVSLGEEF